MHAQSKSAQDWKRTFADDDLNNDSAVKDSRKYRSSSLILMVRKYARLGYCKDTDIVDIISAAVRGKEENFRNLAVSK